MRAQTAIEDADLFEVGQHRQRGVGAVAVTQRLEVRVGAAVQVHAGLLGLDKKAHVAEVGREVEGVVGTLLCSCRAYGHSTFDLDLLLVRVVLALVVDIPSERLQQWIDEVLARLGFLVAGLEVIVARIFLEAIDQFDYAGVGHLELSHSLDCVRHRFPRNFRHRVAAG